MTTPITALILPGIGSSGPQHWQSCWERRDATCVRVQQDEWDAPRRADWEQRLSEVVGAHEGPVVLVGHSSACALVAHWTLSATPAHIEKVRAALLVAPSDPEGPNYPVGPTGFAPVPLHRLPFESVVIASDDDPYVSAEQARRYAAAWGSRLIHVPNAGHINVASGHGEWPTGFDLLASLRNRPGAPLSSDVERYVRGHYPPDDQPTVLQLLSNAVIHDGTSAEPRLLRCAAVGGRGTVDGVRRLVRDLRIDLRDVIVEGEYESVDGKLVRVRNLMEPLAE